MASKKNTKVINDKIIIYLENDKIHIKSILKNFLKEKIINEFCELK